MQQEVTFAVSADQISCAMEDETIVLHIGSGTYYGLNDVAATVWNLLQQRPHTLDEICAQIGREYEVDSERCRSDLRELFEQLATAGLVELRNT